jgi:hypothetical protein
MTESVAIESLFNSVERELVRRWACHHVPQVFVNRPVQHLRLIVKAWWNIYQESRCARAGENRTIWNRDTTCPPQELEGLELVETLARITSLIDVDALLMYRDLSSKDKSGICLLTVFTAYYSSPQSAIWMQIL